MRSRVRWTVAGITAVALYFKHFFTSTAAFTPESLDELKTAVETCAEPSTTTPSVPERIKLKKTGPTRKEQDYIVINGYKRPPLVLIHGLDSTRFTWNSFINKSSEKWNMVAVDQRGWGESPLGYEDEYTAAAVAADIKYTLQEDFGDQKVVLLGHSMGGKVAMKFAADYPERVAGLIIEDMDIDIVDGSSERWTDRIEKIVDPVADLKARRKCGRVFSSFTALSEVLSRWYNTSRIESWREDGRVFQKPDGTWWSGVSPLTQYLSYHHVLMAVGKEEWSAVGKGEYPVKLFVAGKGSACMAANIEGMVEMVSFARVVNFPNANHSIHNARDSAIVDKFIRAVEEMYTELEYMEALDEIQTELKNQNITLG